MRTKQKTKHDKISGIIEKIFWTNGKFTYGKLTREREKEINFKGAITVEIGNAVDLFGEFIIDPKYGETFVVKNINFHTTLSTTGLTAFIAKHPSMKHIGPKRAAKLVAFCGDSFTEYLETKPDELAKIAGVKIEVIHRLADSWAKTSQVNQALVFLSAFGLTHYQVKTIVDKFGNNAVGLFKENPYLLIREIKGWAFKKVDAMALRSGIEKKNENRMRAGIFQAVTDELDKGHCWTDLEELINNAQKLLSLDDLQAKKLIEKYIDELVAQGDLCIESDSSRFLLALPLIRDREQELRVIFAKGFEKGMHFSKNEIGTIPKDIYEMAPTLNGQQLEAASKGLFKKISLITGGAGVGKTFTAATLFEYYSRHGLEIIMAAPTGKAAKRLEEMSGQEGFTIHRLLKYNGQIFEIDENDPLDADLIIVDEFSMVDIHLAWHLFKAIDLDKTNVILLGDHNQLPPIGAGNILRDIVDRNLTPLTKLTTVVRQAGLLKVACNAILEGVVFRTPDPIHSNEKLPWYRIDKCHEPSNVKNMLIEIFNGGIKRLGYDPIAETQLLSPTRKGTLGVENLNIELQQLFQKKFYNVDVEIPDKNRKPQPYLHDKVIQRRNNYKLGIMNGSVGIVTDLKKTTGKQGFYKGKRFVTNITVDFDGNIVELSREHLLDLDLAYCLTIHQSQGSEFPCVVVIIHRSHQYQHNRNLIYTGVTRAKKTAIIIGDNYGIRECARRTFSGERRTFLSLLSKEELI